MLPIKKGKIRTKTQDGISNENTLGYITMQITIQELCVYNLVLETTTVISVDVFAVYTCQLIENIRI